MISLTSGGIFMPLIKPISDLRNKSNEISALAHKSNEPIFITKNGEGDLVVMSMEQYASMEQRLALYQKLAVAQAQKSAGDKGHTLKKVMTDIRRRIHEKG
jgi:prevent-host-death family protein